VSRTGDKSSTGGATDNKEETKKRRGKKGPLTSGAGICDTRWDVRASTLHRYTQPVVLAAAARTLDHVIETTTDANARATAIGLKKSIHEPEFLLMFTSFKSVLGAVNVVSKYLQTVQTDVGTAMDKVEALKSEVRLLRTEETWEKARKEAVQLAGNLGIDLEGQIRAKEESTRPRKKPKRIDDRPETAVSLGVVDNIRTQHYFPSLHKLITELDTRFPDELKDFKYLQPNNFFHEDAPTAVSDWLPFTVTTSI